MVEREINTCAYRYSTFQFNECLNPSVRLHNPPWRKKNKKKVPSYSYASCYTVIYFWAFNNFDKSVWHNLWTLAFIHINTPTYFHNAPKYFTKPYSIHSLILYYYTRSADVVPFSQAKHNKIIYIISNKHIWDVICTHFSKNIYFCYVKTLNNIKENPKKMGIRKKTKNVGERKKLQVIVYMKIHKERK